ncbi:rhodanese-like domain-containing protein [Marinomonas sp. 15G1-11]|uniref:Rhodanese-like domain-containing protein n=1 Tax=Marinomonas phaeophyticola TaxID=3004091 RepID=A0ABT4K0U2_9GAMM|nr:rhodanese-like domain-containing protein [Marinomonas sp. 15G1-11]MCZ2723633.1 rhodanese-like domain-containing protein [Marinomonas sp. 15G1-11]
MMNQLIEFATTHWTLVAIFMVTALAVFWFESKGNAAALSPAAATTLINNEDAVVIDIRPATEFRTGHITNSINIPASTIKDQIDTLEKHKNTPIILVCKSGLTSGASASELQKSGFKVFKLQGGITEWQSASLPLVKK